MSTDTTPPPVGTIMKWGEWHAEVLVSSPEYMTVRDEGGWLYALEHVDGEWRDHDGDVWEIVAPAPAGDSAATATPTVDASAVGALTDRLAELETVVEELNRRLCDAEDETDGLEAAQPDTARISDLPTLPVGTVLKCRRRQHATVVRSAPGFVLVDDPKGSMALYWHWLHGWISSPRSDAWTVRP